MNAWVDDYYRFMVLYFISLESVVMNFLLYIIVLYGILLYCIVGTLL